MEGLPVDLIFPILVGGFIAGVVAVVAWALRKPLLLVVSATPVAVLRDLAYRLRFLGYPVDASRSPIRIKIDSLSAVKIHVRAGPRGTEIRYEVDATTVGWAVVFVLLLTGYVAFLSLAVAIFIHVTAASFARRRVLSAIAYPPLGTLPGPDVHSFLIEGLSEAQRLASEAFEWEREASQNAIALILVGSLFLWAVSLFGLAALFPGLGLLLDALVATAGSGAAAALGSWAVRVRARPSIRELEQDVDTYRMALANEIMGTPTPQATRGGLELLLYAARRSPRWREIRRRRRTWHDPWLGFTVFVFADAAFLPLVLAVMGDFLSLPWRVGLVAISGLAVLGAVVTVRSERRGVREQDERDRLDWERRTQEVETAFWKLLSG